MQWDFGTEQLWLCRSRDFVMREGTSYDESKDCVGTGRGQGNSRDSVEMGHGQGISGTFLGVEHGRVPCRDGGAAGAPTSLFIKDVALCFTMVAIHSEIHVQMDANPLAAGMEGQRVQPQAIIDDTPSFGVVAS
eukprot:765768-Pelagomonas_calceolata.AAC.1